MNNEETELPATTPLTLDNPPSGAYLEHLRKINDVFYDQIKIADQKAAYIFTFMLAFMFTSVEGRGVFTINRYIASSPAVIGFSVILAIALCVTLVAAIMVVLPRVRLKGTSLFWGSWEINRKAFMEAADEADTTYLFQQYLGNVDNLALIARTKYRFVTISFRGLIFTVLSYVGLLLVS